ncbi:MAG: response regulator [Planctomycetota bacterium]|jgi:two-component system chemotaxis response regulator CheY
MSKPDNEPIESPPDPAPETEPVPVERAEASEDQPTTSAEEDTGTDQAEEQTEETGEKETPKGPPPIALIVEDSKIIRRMLTMQIGTLGFEVLEAIHGQQALERLERIELERCKVIFLDIMMPEMDGLAFLQTARKTYGENLPPVIICTTKNDPKTVKAFAAAGAKGYILKPFKTEILQQKLRKLDLLP